MCLELIVGRKDPLGVCPNDLIVGSRNATDVWVNFSTDVLIFTPRFPRVESLIPTERAKD